MEKEIYDSSEFEELMKEGYQQTASLNYQIAEDYIEIALEYLPEW